jgi:hypothetical protein
LEDPAALIYRTTARELRAEVGRLTAERDEAVARYERAVAIHVGVEAEWKAERDRLAAERDDALHLLADCRRGRQAAQDEAFRRGDERDMETKHPEYTP